jgi:arsenate reductase-like glutaredoxin family protein
MKKVQILHNPRCGKSREALQLLQAEECEVKNNSMDYIRLCVYVV